MSFTIHAQGPENGNSFGPQIWLALGIAALAGAFLFAYFKNWAYDDPYITYRYAENIHNGLGMVYNPGERVLSTTTPLFALILAALRYLWVDIPLMANLIGALSLAAGAFLLWDIARTLDVPSAGWAALLLYPTFPLLTGTIGSETPLYLALSLGAFACYARKKYTLTALFTALAILARGDGVLVAGILGVDYLIREKRLPPAGSGAVFLGVLLPWVVFASLYFGSPLPVTLSAKRAQGIMSPEALFAPGLWGMLRGYAGFVQYRIEGVLLFVGAGFALWRMRSWTAFLAWPVLYGLAYTALGVTRYFWYYAPLVPGAVVAVSLAMEGLVRLARKSSVVSARYSLFGLLGLLLAGLVVFQISDLQRLRSNPDERYLAYRAVGEWLAGNAPAGATVGTLEVGIIGYYAPQPMVGFAGLVKPEVAAQFQPGANYQDAALWAVERFQPQYLVLPRGMFGRLERGYASQSCEAAAEFPGDQYGYSLDLQIYACP